jgi:glutamate 5-kinase
MSSRIGAQENFVKKIKPLKRWVIKAGSQMVCAGGPILVRSWMMQVATLRKKHSIEVIWVTSGAISSAIDRTDFKKAKPGARTLPEKQALSAIGQPFIMDLYNLALQASGLLGAQVLLTAGDLKDPKRKRNLQNTLAKLLEWKTVPILNENDAVATEEIQFGDNDSLSAQIAKAMRAERLVLLTDVSGLYDNDPKTNPDARLIEDLKNVTPQILSGLAKHGGSSRGTGGMYSKLLAAKAASQAGITTHLVLGDQPDQLLKLARGEVVGTRIGAKE